MSAADKKWEDAKAEGSAAVKVQHSCGINFVFLPCYLVKLNRVFEILIFDVGTLLWKFVNFIFYRKKIGLRRLVFLLLCVWLKAAISTLKCGPV